MATGFLTILSGCALVTQKDETLYFPIGSGDGAVLEHTLSSAQAILTPAQWAALENSTPLVCMSDEAYGDYKSAVEILCNANPTECTTETVIQINSFDVKTKKVFAYIRRVHAKNMELQNVPTNF